MTILSDLFDTNFSSTSLLGYTILSAYVLYTLSTFVHNAFFHPLARFPGPISHAGSAIPDWWQLWNGREHLHKKALHDKYGPVVRVAPDTLSYNNAQAWKDIYGHVQGRKQIPKDLKFYVPGRFFRKKEDSKVSSVDKKEFGSKRSLINAGDEDHARMRRLISHAFSAAALREQEEILTKYFDLLIQRLKEQIAGPSKGVVDLTAWYNYATFDIIGDLSFGESFGMLEGSQPHDFMTRIALGTKYIVYMWTGLLFPVFGLLLGAYFMTPSGSQLRKRQAQFSKERVAKRLNTDTDRRDFIYYMLRYNDDRGMSNYEIDMSAKTLLNAGSETTATAIPGATFLLLQNPDALAKVVAEVRAHFKGGKEITMQSTSSAELPYLFAVIEETLRVYPPISLAFPRRTIVPTEIDGQMVPTGTKVGVHHYATYHSALNFKDPDAFVPERWMGDEKYAQDRRDAFNPFSTGPRNCIGKNLAYAEMASILARVLFHFDIQLCDESQDWIAQQKTMVMWQKEPLMVKLSLAKTD